MRSIFALTAMLLLASPHVFAAQDLKRQAECKTKLEKAHKIGVIRQINFKGSVPVAIVDGDIWKRMDFDSKVGMVETIACYVMSGSKDMIPVTIRDHRSDKVIGEFNGIRLTIP